MDGTVTAVAVVHQLKPKTWEVPYTTGIDKSAVEGRVPLAVTGLAGDVQCDREHHGGTWAAVYAYADEDAAAWAAELGYPVEPGRFGENLRTAGIDVTGAEIGERWQVGAPGEGTLLEVTSPRTPCRTFSDHMGEAHWVKRFTQRGAPGAYFRVLEPGGIAAGDAITVVRRPGHGVTVGRTTNIATRDDWSALLQAATDHDLDLDPDFIAKAEYHLARA